MKPTLIDEQPKSDFQSSTTPKFEFWGRKSMVSLGCEWVSRESVWVFLLEKMRGMREMRSTPMTPNPLMQILISEYDHFALN